MNLKELARSKGTTLNKVAEKCGIPASTLYAISSGVTNFDKVGIATFMKVAEALDITPEELYGKSKPSTDRIRVELSKDERYLIDTYRSLTRVNQHGVIMTAYALKDFPDNDVVPMTVTINNDPMSKKLRLATGNAEEVENWNSRRNLEPWML